MNKAYFNSECEPSLFELNQDDIVQNEFCQNREAKRKKNAVIGKAITFLSVAVFVAAIAVLISTFINYKRGDDIYSDISSDFHDDTENLTYLQKAKKQNTTPDFAQTLDNLSKGITYDINYSDTDEILDKNKAKMNRLKEKYPDLYGWITLDGTTIDYPIVKTDNNSYYLNHAPTGDYLPAGSIFCDYRVKDGLMNNRNVVIYGHNMYNGLMFNSITFFLDKDYFYAHNTVKVYTEDGIYTYKIFAIKKVDGRSEYIDMNFSSDDEYLAFLERMKNDSLYNVEGIEFNADSKIITLSTCTNLRAYERYTIQALLIEKITYQV